MGVVMSLIIDHFFLQYSAQSSLNMSVSQGTSVVIVLVSRRISQSVNLSDGLSYQALGETVHVRVDDIPYVVEKVLLLMPNLPRHLALR